MMGPSAILILRLLLVGVNLALEKPMNAEPMNAEVFASNKVSLHLKYFLSEMNIMMNQIMISESK